jgi:hypothetical protein
MGDSREHPLSLDLHQEPDRTTTVRSLRIEFYGAEDLAAKLFELSQAMANDWQAFARAVEEETGAAGAAFSAI